MLKTVINTFRKSKGYVSIETIIVIGLMATIGSYAFKHFILASNTIINNSIETLEDVDDFIKDNPILK